MKAIILAAGEGKRLRPLTENRPKAMVEVRGTSLLERQLQQLKLLGVDDVVIVTGYCNQAIDNLSKRYHAETVFNDQYSTTNMVFSLSKTLPLLKRETQQQILILYGDIAYTVDHLRLLMEESSDSTMVILGNRDWLQLWSARIEDPLSDAETFIFDEAMRLIDIGKKPSSYKQIMAQYMGMIKVTGSFLYRLMSDYQKSASTELVRNMYMTDLIQQATNIDTVSVILVDGGWIEMDTLKDYLLYSDESAGTFGVFS